MMVFNDVSRFHMISGDIKWFWECQAPTNPLWNLLKPPGTIQIIFSDCIDSMNLVTDCDLQCLMNIHICICSRKYQSEFFYWSFIVNTNKFLIVFFLLSNWMYSHLYLPFFVNLNIFVFPFEFVKRILNNILFYILFFINHAP